jgi:hypothetical protein
MGYNEWRKWDLDRQFRQYQAKRQHEDELARQAARRPVQGDGPPAAAQQNKLRLQNPRKAKAL